MNETGFTAAYPADAPEDDTDRAIRLARDHSIEAVGLLIEAMRNDSYGVDERVKAASYLLEVAGCL